MGCDNPSYVNVGWDAVAWSSLFVLFNIILSIVLKMGLELSLIIASVRCVVQLTLMAYVLGPVLESKEAWVPVLMACGFVVLASYETTFHQAKVRHNFMLPVVFIAILVSTASVGILGLAFVIRVDPFWEPQQFIPIIGLLLGNSMSGMAVGISHALQTLHTNSDQVQTYLSYGASRWETALPIAIPAIKFGMIPTLNSMAVMGIISIPGMMTGQILGGADVFDAVRYQHVTMFMILSSTALGTLMSVAGALLVTIDKHHRFRPEFIHSGPAWHSKLFITYLHTPLLRITTQLRHRYRNRTFNPSSSSSKDVDMEFPISNEKVSS